jgi:hypothetical protein
MKCPKHCSSVALLSISESFAYVSVLESEPTSSFLYCVSYKEIDSEISGIDMVIVFFCSFTQSGIFVMQRTILTNHYL